MKTDLKLYQQYTVAGVGVVAIIIGVYAFFEAKAILSWTAWGVAVILLWYLIRHRVDVN